VQSTRPRPLSALCTGWAERRARWAREASHFSELSQAKKDEEGNSQGRRRVGKGLKSTEVLSEVLWGVGVGGVGGGWVGGWVGGGEASACSWRNSPRENPTEGTAGEQEHRPSNLVPQQKASPLTSSPHECSPPAEMYAQRRPPATSRGTLGVSELHGGT
jgi:hypothetical protein